MPGPPALASVLGADDVRYRLGAGPQWTVLHPDGSVTRGGRAVDVDRSGLPTDDTITIAVTAADGGPAHFLVRAAGRVARPSLEQRQVAVLLARTVAPGSTPVR